MSVARQNYAFAKRQRDLAKKQKTDEKKQRKQAAAAERPEETPAEPVEGERPGATDAD